MYESENEDCDEECSRFGSPKDDRIEETCQMKTSSSLQLMLSAIAQARSQTTSGEAVGGSHGRSRARVLFSTMTLTH